MKDVKEVMRVVYDMSGVKSISLELIRDEGRPIIGSTKDNIPTIFKCTIEIHWHRNITGFGSDQLAAIIDAIRGMIYHDLGGDEILAKIEQSKQY